MHITPEAPRVVGDLLFFDEHEAAPLVGAQRGRVAALGRRHLLGGGRRRLRPLQAPWGVVAWVQGLMRFQKTAHRQPNAAVYVPG